MTIIAAVLDITFLQSCHLVEICFKLHICVSLKIPRKKNFFNKKICKFAATDMHQEPSEYYQWAQLTV